MKPNSNSKGDNRGEPGLESESQADQKNQVAKIHWVSGVGVGSHRNQPLRRCFQSGTTTAPFDAIEPAEPILKIAPEHQREKQRMEVQIALAG